MGNRCRVFNKIYFEAVRFGAFDFAGTEARFAFALAEGQYATAVRCEELMGKELGMFVDRVQKLPTRFEDLPEEIQEQIIADLNARVEAEERAKLEAQKQLPAGEQTVGVTGD